jgi:hypothetical protein
VVTQRIARLILLDMVLAIALVAILLLHGCATPIVGRRFDKIIRIPMVTVHICSDNSCFPAGCKDAWGNIGNACGDSDGRIWVKGYEKGGKYYLDALESGGHELVEVMRFRDKTIASPHEYRW